MRRAAGLTLVLPLLGAVLAAAAEPPPPPAATPAAPSAPAAEGLRGWKSLTLKAESSPLYTGTITLQLSEGTHAATGRAAVILETRSEARLLGAIGLEERTTSWIDARDRRPLELFQMRPDDNARRFRYEAAGIVQTTWKPPEGRRGVPFEQWRELETTTRRAVLADGTPLPEGAWVTDAYALVAMLPDLSPASGAAGPKDFFVLQRRQVVRLRVTPGERRSRTRDVVNEADGRSLPLALGERRLDLTAEGEEGRNVRGLMGMQGAVEIWVDEISGAPVELKGSAPGIGPTTVSLVSFRR